MASTSRIAIRLPEDLKFQLEKEAEKLNIGLSKLIRNKLRCKHISKPKLYINHNHIIPFEDFKKAKVIFDDIEL
jgi:antitoxin component of RelBE/YafQ-DinJ toxin-antitoxin module